MLTGRRSTNCSLVRELFTAAQTLFSCRRFIVYWYASYSLLVRELLFTGTRALGHCYVTNLLLCEILFAVTRVIVYWYASYSLLVGELLFTGTRALCHWYTSNLQLRELLFTAKRVIVS